jgi:hypothetical protein
MKPPNLHKNPWPRDGTDPKTLYPETSIRLIETLCVTSPIELV